MNKLNKEFLLLALSSVLFTGCGGDDSSSTSSEKNRDSSTHCCVKGVNLASIKSKIIAPGTVKITWNPVSGAKSYEVKRARNIPTLAIMPITLTTTKPEIIINGLSERAWAISIYAGESAPNPAYFAFVMDNDKVVEPTKIIAGDSLQPEEGSVEAYILKHYNENRASGFTSDDGTVYKPITVPMKVSSEISDAVTDFTNQLPHSTSSEIFNFNPWRIQDGETEQSKLFDSIMTRNNLKIGEGFSNKITWGDDSNMTNWFENNSVIFSPNNTSVCGFSPIYNIEPYEYAGVLKDKGMMYMCAEFEREE